jgi:hypothetical protein
VEKWQDDLAKIAFEVVVLISHRSVYRAVSEIIAANDELPPSLFYSLLSTTYGDSQIVAIRRQAEAEKSRVSLARLLTEIKAEPERLTRERFLTTHEFGFQLGTEADWKLRFAGKIGKHLDAKIVADDLAELRKATDGLKAWRDLRVAHASRERVQPEHRVTFDHIDEAVEAIGRLFRKYDLLVRGGESPVNMYFDVYLDVKPDLLPLFSVPWVRS